MTMHSNPVPADKIGLGPWHMSTNAAIVIDQGRLDVLRTSMNFASVSLGFEDRYAMVIDNLFDLERHLFNWALLDMLRPAIGFAEMFSHKRDANRLLGTC